MPDTESAIEEMVRRIVEAVHPDKIILFGSHARGEAGPDSDVDLLIVAPSEERPWRRTGFLYTLLAGLGVAKDVIWLTQQEIDEWRNVRSHFVSTAVREGRILYARPT